MVQTTTGFKYTELVNVLVLEYFDIYEPPGNGVITSITMYISVLRVSYLLLNFAWLKKSRKGNVEKLSHHSQPSSCSYSLNKGKWDTRALFPELWPGGQSYTQKMSITWAPKGSGRYPGPFLKKGRRM